MRKSISSILFDFFPCLEKRNSELPVTELRYWPKPLIITKVRALKSSPPFPKLEHPSLNKLDSVPAKFEVFGKDSNRFRDFTVYEGDYTKQFMSC